MGSEFKSLRDELKTASAEERRRALGAYSAWIWAGAKAQGGWRWGLVLFAAALFLAFRLGIAGLGSPLMYAGCAVAALAGFLITRVGFRRERDWRRRNPFRSGPSA